MTASYCCGVSVTHMDMGRASPEVSSSVKQLVVNLYSVLKRSALLPPSGEEGCSLVSTTYYTPKR